MVLGTEYVKNLLVHIFIIYLYKDDLGASPKQQLDSSRISILK